MNSFRGGWRKEDSFWLWLNKKIPEITRIPGLFIFRLQYSIRSFGRDYGICALKTIYKNKC